VRLLWMAIAARAARHDGGGGVAGGGLDGRLGRGGAPHPALPTSWREWEEAGVREAPGKGFLVLFCKKELPSCFDFVRLWLWVSLPSAHPTSEVSVGA
jgi:hypothetical protein